jgi:hypothetical protein
MYGKKGGEIMEERKPDRRNIWQKENQERIVVMTSKTEPPTKAQIRAAAAAAGQSVNAWIIEAIRDKL